MQAAMGWEGIRRQKADARAARSHAWVAQNLGPTLARMCRDEWEEKRKEDPRRDIGVEVMPDEWFDNEQCNRALTGKEAARLVKEDAERIGLAWHFVEATCELLEGMSGEDGRHRRLASVRASHLSGMAHPPTPAAFADALHGRGDEETRKRRVKMLTAEIDKFGPVPCETIICCVEEGLTLRQLARALREAEQ